MVQLLIRCSTTDVVNYRITDPLGRVDDGVTTDIPDCDRIGMTGSEVQNLVDLAAKLDAEDQASATSDTGEADAWSDDSGTTGSDWDSTAYAESDTTDPRADDEFWSGYNAADEYYNGVHDEQIVLVTVSDPTPGTWTIELLGDSGSTTTIAPTAITDVGRCTCDVRTEILTPDDNLHRFTCTPTEYGCAIQWED